MDSTTLYQHILGLRSPWTVSRVDMQMAREEIHVYVEHGADSRFCCPECKRELSVYDHTPERTWRHLDTCQLKTFLHARAPRVQCPDHKTLTASLPWAEPGSGFTALFERLAIELLLVTPATRAQGILRVSADQLGRIKAKAVERGLSRREAAKASGKHPVFEHGCVDEKSWKKGRRFGTIIGNVGAGLVEEVYEGRAGDGLAVFYDAMTQEARDGIKSMSQDFHAGFSGVTVQKLAQGKDVVAFDPFHLMMHVNEAVLTTHRSEVSQARKTFEKGRDKRMVSAVGKASLHAEQKLKHIVGAKWALVRGSENRTDKQREQLSWLDECSHYDSAEAWRLKEKLRSMWRVCEDVESAEKWLKDWCLEVRSGLVSAMKKIANMLENHAWGILNAFRMGLSNSPAENINSKIQAIKAKARGHASFTAFKNDVFFHLGALDLYPRAGNA
ncbi:MAG: hypothetical protein RL091_560 [Verrucomicrobiota bacterium]